ncbi:hypothetical protein [Urechidicola vernalis]|uniref:DUF4440 domain-containing protein n=1 Tax=Urechidicola vernalis TaxID=3075600 RepID=A0ABU2Y6E7_9FLAO|nr:hypothetical protein [Urechidicola sp. P050]MDT0553776.1 hypothetical protein [Urechidicola sp. P050]
MKLPVRKIKGIALIAILLSNVINAQISNDNDLFQVLKAKDSLFFEVGFNKCNLEVFQELLPEEFEFYHDKDGITESRAKFIRTLKKNICGTEKNNIKRVLEKGSLEVFPLYNKGNLYGAIQTGRHSFGSTIARFTNLWILEQGKWMPTRMMSYDHKINTAPIVSNVEFIKLSHKEMSIYLGNYEFSPDFTLSIIIIGDKIYGDAQGQKVEINYYGDHKFLDNNQAMKLNFILNDEGIVTGLKMIGRDREMVATDLLNEVLCFKSKYKEFEQLLSKYWTS